MSIKISLGTNLIKKGITQGSSYSFRSETFEPSFWLNEEQQEALASIASQDWPTPVLGYEIVRGAFHGEFTRIRPLLEDGNWGRDYTSEYNQLLDEMAKAIGWHHVRIDGANAVVKQESTGSTWQRWKKNNPSSHLREASKKNWEAYHTWIGDLDEVGEWDDAKFDPSKWWDI
jgi:hypothetical protein